MTFPNCSQETYLVEVNGNGPHRSDCHHLCRSAADACAYSAVRRNEVPGHSDIDDPSEDRRRYDITLTLQALQKVLHRTHEGFGHAQQGCQSHNHGRAFVLVAVEQKQRRSSQCCRDDVQRDRGQNEIAEPEVATMSGSRDLSRPY